MSFALIVDLGVSLLLVATIVVALTLNKRLTKLRNDKKDLENLARTFGDATMRAEENINQLRTIAQALDIQMNRAQTLRDDLTFLVERGGSAADRLEELVREARDGLGVVPSPASSRPAVSAGKVGIETRSDEEARRSENENNRGTEPRSEAERELLRALRDAG